MSYILEALKKADADRERSHVPDLHARPDPTVDHERWRTRSRPSLWAAVALLGLLGAGLTWWAWRPAAPQDALVNAPVAAPAVAPPPVAASRPVAAETATGRDLTAPAVIAVQIAPPAVPRPLADAIKPPSVAAAAAANPPAAAASPAVPRLPLLAELPAEVRSQLPVLNVGGSMYSTSAAVRMVILSGQVFREGDSPAPGLTVVQIGPKSTVLAFRGQRFELKH